MHYFAVTKNEKGSAPFSNAPVRKLDVTMVWTHRPDSLKFSSVPCSRFPYSVSRFYPNSLAAFFILRTA